MKKSIFYPIIILTVFLFIGLNIYDDFGVTLDEPNQIDSGHIIYKYLCVKFGKEVPEPIKNVPDLYSYRNRFYGQAATFPTVIIEAVHGFTMDSSTIIRMRHLWNFITYFIGLACFTVTTGHIYKSWRKSTLGLLMLIFLPRIFGDIFYNDRDTMLLAWFMISLSAFYWYKQHPCFFTGAVCAFCFGITINIRFFGLLLFIFPAVFFNSSKTRKGDILVIIASLLFFFIVSPIYWEDPFHSILAGPLHLSTKQRSFDSNNSAASLFFGKMVSEDDLPWYYIPVYIFITTPIITSIVFLSGCAALIKKIKTKQRDLKTLFGICMMIILFPFLLLVILFRPTLYNGWRHFYFLYLPIIWVALEGSDIFFRQKNKTVRFGSLAVLGCSLICSLSWMVYAHPYHYTYINPVFRKQLSGKFTRDYWCLAATDAMKYLLKNVESYPIHIVDHDMVKVNQMVLPPAERQRFHTYRFPVQPYPVEYEYIQYGEYSDSLVDEISIDYYAPYYKIERDNVLFAEVFQRTHNFEYRGNDIIKTITGSNNDPSAELMADGNFDTAWEPPGGSAEIVMEFNRIYTLTDIEVFPVLKSYHELPDYRLCYSADGISWKSLDYERKGANGLSFSPAETGWLKIMIGPDTPGINDILFHGQ